MSHAADLRRHADHCRYLADFMPSPQDRRKLVHAAREFDAEALQLEQNAREAELRSKAALQA